MKAFLLIAVTFIGLTTFGQKAIYYIDSVQAEKIIYSESKQFAFKERRYLKKIEQSQDSAETYIYRKSDNQLYQIRVLRSKVIGKKRVLLFFSFLDNRLFNITCSRNDSPLLGRRTTNTYYFENNKLIYQYEALSPESVESLLALSKVYFLKCQQFKRN